MARIIPLSALLGATAAAAAATTNPISFSGTARGTVIDAALHPLSERALDCGWDGTACDANCARGFITCCHFGNGSYCGSAYECRSGGCCPKGQACTGPATCRGSGVPCGAFCIDSRDDCCDRGAGTFCHAPSTCRPGNQCSNGLRAAMAL